MRNPIHERCSTHRLEYGDEKGPAFGDCDPATWPSLPALDLKLVYSVLLSDHITSLATRLRQVTRNRSGGMYSG